MGPVEAAIVEARTSQPVPEAECGEGLCRGASARHVALSALSLLCPSTCLSERTARNELQRKHVPGVPTYA